MAKKRPRNPLDSGALLAEDGGFEPPRGGPRTRGNPLDHAEVVMRSRVCLIVEMCLCVDAVNRTLVL